MKIFKKALIVVGLALIVFFAVGFLLPSQVHVQRSLVIHATPAQIQPYISDLKRWSEWTPWNKEMDATVVYVYADSEMTWNGEKMGAGTLRITKSEPGIGIWYTIDFNHGSMGSVGRILYQVVPEGTEVVWEDTFELGKNPVNRYFGLLMNSMIGADFDKGLTKLKELVTQHKP